MMTPRDSRLRQSCSRGFEVLWAGWVIASAWNSVNQRQYAV
jgi:hypothetical protein